MPMLMLPALPVFNPKYQMYTHFTPKTNIPFNIAASSYYRISVGGVSWEVCIAVD
jgi:hypothetical protein